MKAIWNNRVIAESDETLIVEGNHYFPPQSVNKKYLENSEMHSACPWKGEASYYDIVVENFRNKDAAWYYPNPKERAENIKGYIAFWRGVKITED